MVSPTAKLKDLLLELSVDWRCDHEYPLLEMRYDLGVYKRVYRYPCPMAV
jgi:hypothetical protein